jgi:hypothetical protein
LTVREEWRWTDERGVQRLVGTDELRAALASGRLPVSTLVWRDGMREWAPADQRPELENAVAIGRAVRARAGAPAGEADRSTPTGILPAKGSAEAKGPSTKPATKPVFKRTDPPPLPGRAPARTLVGVPSPIAERVATVPTTGAGLGKGAPARPGVTQIPERGVPPDGNAVVPRAPAIPSGLGASAQGTRPQRKLTTREIDGQWGATPIGDEDPTHPNAGREALPSFELEVVEEPPSKGAPAGKAAPRPAQPAASAQDKAALKKPASGVEATPDRPTGPTLPSQAISAAAPVGNGVNDGRPKGTVAPRAEQRPAGRSVPPPVPRAGAGRSPSKQPPPLPGRQVTATLVAGSPAPDKPASQAATPASAKASPAAAAAPVSAVSPAATATASPTNGAHVARPPSSPGMAEPPPQAASHDLPPQRPPAPADAGANGAEPAPARRSRASLPPAPASHDGTDFPLPPVMPRGAPLPSFELEPTEQPSEPPPPQRSEPPPAVSEPPPARSRSRDADARGLPVTVPISSLFGAGGALIAMVVAAFFAGRHSAQPTRLVARPVFHLVPLVAKAAIPPAPKPCWVSRQPVMWAPRISKSIPFDMVATATGTLAIGYAREESDAVGLEVTPSSGDVKVRFTQKGTEPIERVIPTGSEFKVSPASGVGGFGSLLHVPGSSPFVVGVKGGALSVADRADAQAAALWPLAGDDAPSALRVQAAGSKGYGVTFRRDGAVWGGWLDAARKGVGGLIKVSGSGGAVGKPSSGFNQHELAVIFADKPEGGDHWEIRVGRAPAGQIPSATQVVPLPKGGPGGDAFAPDIAGLPDGRWLMIWTEGAAGSRAVRAQTFAPDLSPLGDPIALSPPAGNFGQGGIGIAEGYAAAVFLSKGSLGFELWGSILQCG